MAVLVVVERPEDWPHTIAGVEVVSARRYLSDPQAMGRPGTKVFNLCRRYRYQSLGYYVSLLAAARGHRPLPSVATIQDFRQPSILRIASADLEERVQRALRHVVGDEFELSIYFGQNLAKRYARLARDLFNLFPAPLLRGHFRRAEDGWELTSLRPIAMREVPDTHRSFLVAVAEEYFAKRRPEGTRKAPPRWDLAILVNPEEAEPPSNEKAIARFVRAAGSLGFAAETIGPDDFGRLPEFDALLIRETTAVNHHTYRFARRAKAEGLVVIDDPDSIVRCSNKVFLAEALSRAKVPIPPTWIVHRDNLEQLGAELSYPCVLKRPDSSFSLGVVRVGDADAFRRAAREFLETSELLVVQSFVPSDYDWRVGVLAGRPLWACRYFMAPGHWQIIKRDDAGKVADYGNVETVPLDQVPAPVLEAALGACRAVGDGLYGVDVKALGEKVVVIEVNDNPNIDAGFEDSVLGDELYRVIIGEMLRRVERRKDLREEPEA
jgi:glutathione synthase/RimK-type ligase-like ATP-grasp enzyme